MAIHQAAASFGSWKPPSGVNKDADGLLVDLDPIGVEWQSQGTPESVTVYLENVDTQAHSEKRTLGADVLNVVFTPEQVHAVATDRLYHHKNRIRTVVEWSKGKSTSQPVEMLVGIDVEPYFMDISSLHRERLV